ncbi:site-specific DNA-methyltransferase [Streptomyces sp. PKU-EA00015]|uniref:DNA-methyltransferase n=1 Tax=Streptomyces sp. PKU-EA00015 TaxID=2748326 RepID=UPI00159FEEB1|nr:DNA methyltransferase [Streptomyces sp. PKU-EA00015]NWF25294.1 site-specific DNA-methyltransferase [Streptomyces sp. PKU-EA00015]
MTVTDTLDLAVTPPPGGQILHATARATVIWGDCRDPQVIAQVPAGYGLLCTDPPYGKAYKSGRSSNFQQIAGDDGSVDWPAVLAEWVGPVGTWVRGLATKRHVYVFGYTAEQLAGPLRLGGTADLVWDKTQHGSGALDIPWGSSHERITMGVHVKQQANRAAGEGRGAARLRRGTVLRYPRPNGAAARRHSNEKPVPLMADLIESSTVRGDLVVDPCAGSGSTGVAAVLEGRRCFLVEIDRLNAEETVRRVKAAERIADQIDAA